MSESDVAPVFVRQDISASECVFRADGGLNSRGSKELEMSLHSSREVEK